MRSLYGPPVEETGGPCGLCNGYLSPHARTALREDTSMFPPVIRKVYCPKKSALESLDKYLNKYLYTWK